MVPVRPVPAALAAAFELVDVYHRPMAAPERLGAAAGTALSAGGGLGPAVGAADLASAFPPVVGGAADRGAAVGALCAVAAFAAVPAAVGDVADLGPSRAAAGTTAVARAAAEVGTADDLVAAAAVGGAGAAVGTHERNQTATGAYVHLILGTASPSLCTSMLWVAWRTTRSASLLTTAWEMTWVVLWQ